MLKLITTIAKIPLFICALWVICLISVLFHEFGHALAYMLATGDRNWRIQVGQGKCLLDTKVLTVNVLVIDGFFEPADYKADYSKAQLVMTLSGGPIMTFLLVIGLAGLVFGWISLPSEAAASGMIRFLLYAALFLNFLILLWSVIPAHGFFRDMKDVGTDVTQIIGIINDHHE